MGEVSHRVTKGTTPTAATGGFVESGVSFVKVESITEEGRIEPKKLARISDLTHSTLSRSILQQDDILFSIAGTIGRVAMVSREHLPANTNQALAIVRPNPARVDATYLMYCLRDKDRIQDAVSRVVQSVQANLSLAELSNISIVLPPKEDQRAIAAVLRALDDKIAANANLQRLIGDFIQTSYRANLRESVMIPLSETAEFVNGKAFTKGASGTGRVVVRIAELNSGLGKSTVYSDAEVEEKHVARVGDILFAWSGSLTLNRWFRDDAIINQHIFKVIPKSNYPNWLVFELVRARLAEFKSIAADKATTMGHIQRHHLDETVAMPSGETVARMDVQMKALWRRALLAEQESLTLAELRNTLLPELMSGRLRVKDAEKKIEEVV